MGRDKKFLEIGGKYFIQHAIDAARTFSDEIILSLGSQSQREKTMKKTAGITDLKIVVDEVDSKGPVVGVFSGLKECSYEYAAVLPCDTPFIVPGIFKYMIGRREGFDAVVPVRGTDDLEPLHAVYRVSPMIEACRTALKKDALSLTKTVRRLGKVNYIPAEVLRKYDKELVTFQSINTKKDLEFFKDGH